MPEKLIPLTHDEALNELIDYFLGKNWCVVDPLGPTQVNAIAVDEIKKKYSGIAPDETIKKYRDTHKKCGWCIYGKKNPDVPTYIGETGYWCNLKYTTQNDKNCGRWCKYYKPDYNK